MQDSQKPAMQSPLFLMITEFRVGFSRIPEIFGPETICILKEAPKKQNADEERGIHKPIQGYIDTDTND